MRSSADRHRAWAFLCACVWLCACGGGSVHPKPRLHSGATPSTPHWGILGQYLIMYTHTHTHAPPQIISMNMAVFVHIGVWTCFFLSFMIFLMHSLGFPLCLLLLSCDSAGCSLLSRQGAVSPPVRDSRSSRAPTESKGVNRSQNLEPRVS